MSAVYAPTRPDVAAVTQVIRYAQSVMPNVGPPEDVAHLYVQQEIRLHQIPKDVFDAMLVINDDLQWDEVQHWPSEHDQYWSVTLDLSNARATFFTEHIPLPAHAPQGQQKP